MSKEIYLDSAATTKVKQEILEVMLPYFTDKWHNPSSVYSSSVEIKHDIENARKIVGDFIGANADEIFFTSGGSESNCWAIQGYFNYMISEHSCIITSKIEHKSIMECVDNSNYCDIYYIDVDRNGFIDITQLEEILRYVKDDREINNILVSIQFANNEIGVVQHIKEISNVVHKYGAIFHTDAVQSFGQIPISVNELGIDMLSASGHKIGAPKGVGILYKKKDIDIKPLIYGSQMDSMRGSTENVPYIIGMAKAVELCDVGYENTKKMLLKRDYFINALVSKFGCKINGSIQYRLPNNINVTFPQNITGESLLYTLDMSGILISTGSACNSHSIEPSHVLKAINLSDEDVMRTIRISLSNSITYEDIDYAVEEIGKAIKIIELN